MGPYRKAAPAIGRGPFPEGTAWEDYVRVAHLGRGRYYDAHLAWRPAPDGSSQWVTFKLFEPWYAADADVVQRFFDDAAAACRVRHPHVERAFEAGETRGAYWLVVEYVHGEWLDELVRAPRPGGPALPFGAAAAVVADVAEGVHAAHESGGAAGGAFGTHLGGWWTPGDVLVTFEGAAKVVNLAFNRIRHDHCSRDGRSAWHLLEYAAPDVLRSGRPDRRADVFALGTMAWKLTTGRSRLYSPGESSGRDALERLLRATVPPPSSLARDYPWALERAVLRAVAREPGDRFATALEFARALRPLAWPPERVARYARASLPEHVARREARLRAGEGG